MIKIVYNIKPEQRSTEHEWLRDQKIFPAIEDFWDWRTNTAMVRVGVIVSPEQALSIKLRHSLERQDDYKQR